MLEFRFQFINFSNFGQDAYISAGLGVKVIDTENDKVIGRSFVSGIGEEYTQPYSASSERIKANRELSSDAEFANEVKEATNRIVDKLMRRAIQKLFILERFNHHQD